MEGREPRDPVRSLKKTLGNKKTHKNPKPVIHNSFKQRRLEVGKQIELLLNQNQSTISIFPVRSGKRLAQTVRQSRKPEISITPLPTTRRASRVLAEDQRYGNETLQLPPPKQNIIKPLPVPKNVPVQESPPHRTLQSPPVVEQPPLKRLPSTHSKPFKNGCGGTFEIPPGYEPLPAHQYVKRLYKHPILPPPRLGYFRRPKPNPPIVPPSRPMKNLSRGEIIAALKSSSMQVPVQPKPPSPLVNPYPETEAPFPAAPFPTPPRMQLPQVPDTVDEFLETLLFRPLPPPQFVLDMGFQAVYTYYVSYYDKLQTLIFGPCGCTILHNPPK